MKKCVILPLICLGISLSTKGQSGSEVGPLSGSSRIPPSGSLDNSLATAAGFSTVDLFTGKPNINIPIFSKSYGTVAINLSLGYSSGGLQVNQLASPIGFGWQMNTGFSLTRIVRGNADDELDGGTLYRMDTAGNALKPADCRQRVKGYWRNASSVPINEQSSGQTIKDHFLSNQDAEQDVFFLTLNGKSVRFVIGKNSEVFTLSPCNWKIEWFYNAAYILYTPPGTLVDKFKITDENGNIFVFKALSRTESGGWLWGNPDAPIALLGQANLADRDPVMEWEIDQITTYNGQVIKFNYSNNFLVESSPMREVINPPAPQARAIIPSTNWYCYRTSSPAAEATNLLTIRFKPYLQSIVLPEGLSLDFTYGSFPRRDAAYDPTPQVNWKSLPLKEVVIKRNGFTNVTFNFHQSYFDKYVTSGTVPYNTTIYDGVFGGGSGFWRFTATSNLRLKLDSIVVVPESYNVKYKFEYDLDKKMDSRGSAPDHWGFYKGSYTRLLEVDPQLGPIGPEPGIVQPVFNPGEIDNRNADPNLVGANMLKKILFADNSSVEYTFESNKGKMFDFYSGLATSEVFGGGVRIAKIKVFDGINHANDKVTKYDYKFLNNVGSGIIFSKPIYVKEFECAWHGQTKFTSGFSMASAWGFTKDGAACGYSEVQMIYGENGEGGKEVCTFSNLVDGTDININSGSSAYAPFCNNQYLKDWKIGLIKSKKVYDASNNLVSEDTYEYATGEENPSAASLPYFKSVKYDVKKGFPCGIANTNCTNPVTWDFYKKEYYPVRGFTDLVKHTNKDYTLNGTITKTLEYSYDSKHNVKKEMTTGSDGKFNEKRYYRVYDYAVNSNPSFQNLVNGNRMEEIVRIDELIRDNVSAPYKYISSKIKHYNNVLIDAANFIYRVEPVSEYVLKTNQPVLESTVGVFNSAQPIPSSSYYYSDKVFSYNSQGLMSGIDHLGHKSSIVYDNLNVIAEAANAAESDVAYSSFETNNDAQGGWLLETIYMTNTAAYSGSRSAKSSRNPIVLQKTLTPSKTYKISMWVKTGTPVIQFNTGSPLTLTSTGESTENGWTLYSGSFSGKTSLNIASGAQVDEIRLSPIGSTMRTYSYDPFYGRLSECDEQQNATNFIYDFMGRLIEIVNKDGKIVKQYRYGQGTQN